MLLLFVTTVLLAVAQSPASSSSNTRWNFYCAGGNFTPCSKYSKNLNAVATELPKAAAASSLLFANESCGEEEAVYAIAQCQRDTSSSRCETCIIRSFQDAQEVCQHQEGAFVFRDYCTLGFYKKPLVLSPEDASVDALVNNIDEFPVQIHSASYDSVVIELANSVARNASTSTNHFATGQKDFADELFQLKIYALAQCLPSLSADECDSCIATLFDIVLTRNMTAGRAAKVWCNFRYSPQKFFTGQPMLDLPGNTSLPPTKATNDKHKHNCVPVWIAIALGTTTAALLAIILIYWWCTGNQPRQNAPDAGEPGNPAGERENQVDPADDGGNQVGLKNGKTPEEANRWVANWHRSWCG
ncbi:unnamed protein product [Urochloa humidicola]